MKLNSIQLRVERAAADGRASKRDQRAELNDSSADLEHKSAESQDPEQRLFGELDSRIWPLGRALISASA